MTVHIPILLEPIASSLLEPFSAARETSWLVDCTLGGGGHTAEFLRRFEGTPHRVLGVDQDAAAIARAQERFAAEIAEGRLELRHARFSELELGDRPVLGMMADLGFSSDQLEDADRGLSFLSEGPLDMRLDPSRGRSALELLRRVTEQELTELLQELGEERFARQIAASVIRARRQKQLPTTTAGLASLIVQAVPPPARHGRIHAATRAFQALRIAVNEELNELDCLLNRVTLFVKPGGRIAIISFHSLEDRRVKQAWKDRDGPFEPLTKKPIEADETETARNPRSRSAKLRLAERRAAP